MSRKIYKPRKDGRKYSVVTVIFPNRQKKRWTYHGKTFVDLMFKIHKSSKKNPDRIYFLKDSLGASIRFQAGKTYYYNY